MSHRTVATLVSERAERFGDRNPQEIAFLKKKLANASAEEVLHGLLEVFATSVPHPDGSSAQELAGVLLAELQPVAPIDLEAVIRNTLPRYELSVEQLPQYLVKLCGKEAFLDALQRVSGEAAFATHGCAIETMRFWVGEKRTEATPNEA